VRAVDAQGRIAPYSSAALVRAALIPTGLWEFLMVMLAEMVVFAAFAAAGILWVVLVAAYELATTAAVTPAGRGLLRAAFGF
jgi:hypothetical protein